MSDALAIFQAKKLVSASAWSRSFFATEMILLIEQTIRFTPDDFKRILPFTNEMFHCNFLTSSFNTDWSLEYGNESNGYVLRSVPRLFNNGSCSCVVSSNCQQPLRVGPSDVILPGLVIGCSRPSMDCGYQRWHVSSRRHALPTSLAISNTTPKRMAHHR